VFARADAGYRQVGLRLMLTFDDGPDPRGTSTVLDALARAGARATFFVMAPRAQRHPELLARIGDEGHTVALHCDEHVRHGERDRGWLRRDTERALGRLDRVGVSPRLWRAPWGALAPWSQSLAEEFGLCLIGWDVDTHDWRGDAAPAMLQDTRDAMRDGAIVLAHDGLGPGARRADCAQTAAFVGLAARHAAARDLELVAL
jgi:peptidoglycan/xylan/chitin deacetylase (PgdA/CDA1 family)